MALTRQDYIDHWNSVFPTECGGITLKDYNTLISAIRERHVLASPFPPSLIAEDECFSLEGPIKSVAGFPSMGIDILRELIEDIVLDGDFADPQSFGGKGHRLWRHDQDGFFEAAGIGDPSNPQFGVWTNIPDRNGMTPLYEERLHLVGGGTLNPCLPIFKEHVNEIVQAIKTLTRVEFRLSSGYDFYEKNSGQHTDDDEDVALDAAIAAAKVASVTSTPGDWVGYLGAFTPPEFTYRVRYISVKYELRLGVQPASGWDDLPAEIRVDYTSAFIEQDMNGFINNGNGPFIDRAFIIGIVPARSPDDIPDSLNPLRIAATVVDGSNIDFVPYAVGHTPPWDGGPFHFFPHSEAENAVALIYEIDKMEDDRTHTSYSDALIKSTEGAIYATITNFDFQ